MLFIFWRVYALRRGFDLILYDDLDGDSNALSRLHQLDKIERKTKRHFNMIGDHSDIQDIFKECLKLAGDNFKAEEVCYQMMFNSDYFWN